jgi:hypothetical protein
MKGAIIMKKRILAALAAAAISFCAVTVPASAADSEAWPYWPDIFGKDPLYSDANPDDFLPVYALGKDAVYQPGDVNMDGKTDMKDANMMALEYSWFTVLEGAHILTQEQAALGDVWPGGDAVDIQDVQAVVMWYNYHDVIEATDMELTEFVAYWVENEALPV